MILRRTASADEDFDEIWLYVAKDSPSAADRLVDRIEEATAHLADFPDMGVARDDLAEGIRALRVDNLIIFYRRRGDVLMVERILHARLDITPDMF